MEPWHIWIAIGVILLILEILLPSFVAACFFIGCLVSGIVAFFDVDYKIQFLLFTVGTFAAFLGLRPFILKYAYKKSDSIKTNVDALAGKTGRVLITIDNATNEGRVLVEGDDWRALSEHDEIIEAGEKVQVLKVESTILIVKPLIPF